MIAEVYHPDGVHSRCYVFIRPERYARGNYLTKSGKIISGPFADTKFNSAREAIGIIKKYFETTKILVHDPIAKYFKIKRK